MTNIAKGNAPYLHIPHLSKSQQACCTRNPANFARLNAVQGLRDEIRHAQDMLGTSYGYHKTSKRQLEAWQRELEELEERFMTWDNELASLAEALLAKPKFRTDGDLHLADGRWCWVLPAG